MRLSFIIPIYNVEKYVAKCIESFINQTFKDIEIITVDNNSTDNSYEIVKELAKKYKTIKIYQESKWHQQIINMITSLNYLSLENLE